MKFIKKLIILTGKDSGKGTVSLEKNALSLNGRANLHNLNNSNLDYILFIISGSAVFSIALGNKGSISKQFNLPFDTDISAVHCAIISGDSLVLYGTTEKNRMWEGNILDIARRKHLESKTITPKEAAKQNPKTQGNAESNPPAQQQFGFSQRTDNPKNSDKTPISPEQNKSTATDHASLNDTDKEPDHTSLNAAIKEPACNLEKDAINEPDSSFEKDAIKEPDFSFERDADMESDSSIKTGKAKEFENLGATNKTSETEPKTSALDENMETAVCESSLLCHEKKPNISDYFLDIITDYNDEAVAEVNYYNQNKEARPPLTEKYYDRLEEKKASINNQNSINNNNHVNCRNKNYHSNNHASKTSDCTGDRRSDTYYDGLKEKYGYNRNVLNEFRDEPRRNEQPCFYKKPNNIEKQTIETASILKKSGVADMDSKRKAEDIPPLESAYERIRIGTFFEQVKEQIDAIFKSYPKNEELEKLIPESKWAKVDYSGDGKYYVVGLIGKPDYICYGVPATYSLEPPPELDGYCQWLPLDVNNPTQKGYWLLFQDAISGESIKNEII